jgi:hypothetical protein
VGLHQIAVVVIKHSSFLQNSQLTLPNNLVISTLAEFSVDIENPSCSARFSSMCASQEFDPNNQQPKDVVDWQNDPPGHPDSQLLDSASASAAVIDVHASRFSVHVNVVNWSTTN